MARAARTWGLRNQKGVMPPASRVTREQPRPCSLPHITPRPEQKEPAPTARDALTGRPKSAELSQGVRSWPAKGTLHSEKPGRDKKEQGQHKQTGEGGHRVLVDGRSVGGCSDWGGGGFTGETGASPSSLPPPHHIPHHQAGRPRPGSPALLQAQPGPLQTQAASHYPEEPLDRKGLKHLTNARPLIRKLLTSPGRMLIRLPIHRLCLQLEANITQCQAPPTPSPHNPSSWAEAAWTDQDSLPPACALGHQHRSPAPRD